ncbi:DNA polymerase IV [Streptococcus pneumoniae]|nr:DNA polymerase IV [Streptococcus pneumoniae]
MSLFIIDLMGLFFYNKIGSIISIVDLPTTNIIESSFSTKIMFLNNLYLSSLYNPPQSVFAISFNAMTIPLLHFF